MMKLFAVQVAALIRESAIGTYQSRGHSCVAARRSRNVGRSRARRRRKRRRVTT
ncbi:hypothetical protein L195_g060022, partial [Trifolium pratense]